MSGTLSQITLHFCPESDFFYLTIVLIVALLTGSQVHSYGPLHQFMKTMPRNQQLPKSIMLEAWHANVTEKTDIMALLETSFAVMGKPIFVEGYFIAVHYSKFP